MREDEFTEEDLEKPTGKLRFVIRKKDNGEVERILQYQYKRDHSYYGTSYDWNDVEEIEE